MTVLTPVLLVLAQAVLLLAVAPLAVAVIKRVKARLQCLIGPAWLQAYRDLA